jgi:hypothetical protein
MRWRIFCQRARCYRCGQCLYRIFINRRKNHIASLCRLGSYAPQTSDRCDQVPRGLAIGARILPRAAGGSNDSDGSYAGSDCRFLSVDVRTGKICRGCHQQRATVDLTRGSAFRRKGKRKIRLSNCSFSPRSAVTVQRNDHGCGLCACFDRCFSHRLSLLRGDQPRAVLIRMRESYPDSEEFQCPFRLGCRLS